MIYTYYFFFKKKKKGFCDILVSGKQVPRNYENSLSRAEVKKKKSTVILVKFSNTLPTQFMTLKIAFDRINTSRKS